MADSKRECSFAITVRYKPDWKDTSSDHMLDHISRRWHMPVLYCSKDVNTISPLSKHSEAGLYCLDQKRHRYQAQMQGENFMPDTRLQRMAQVLVRYSLGIKMRDRPTIETSPIATPLVHEVDRDALNAGAYSKTFLA